MTLTQIAEIATIISGVISLIGLFISIMTMNEVKKIKVTLKKDEKQNNKAGILNFGSTITQTNNK